MEYEIIKLAKVLKNIGHYSAFFEVVNIHKASLKNIPYKVLINSNAMQGGGGYTLTFRPLFNGGILGKEEVINYTANKNGSDLLPDRDPRLVIDSIFGVKNKILSTLEVELNLTSGMSHLDFKIPIK